MSKMHFKALETLEAEERLILVKRKFCQCFWWKLSFFNHFLIHRYQLQETFLDPFHVKLISNL